MAACNQSVSLVITYGQNITAELTITRTANSNVSLQDANLEFTYGQSYESPIQTIQTTNINKTTNTDSLIVANFQIDKNLIGAAVTNSNQTFVWQLNIIAVSGSEAQARGTLTIEPGFVEDGDITEPTPIVPRVYITTDDLDPAGATDDQILVYDAAQGKFVPENNSGGGGTSDHGALTGLADDDHTQYLNNARFDTRLSAKVAADFSASIQASLALADSALQTGANISAITGLQSALDDKQPLDTVLTQLSDLAVANGQVVGWSGGALANISIPGGGDMSKSVYDSNDDGVIDVGAIPDLSGTYATSAQGNLADSALQPSDIGVSVQGYDANLTELAALAYVGDRYLGTDGAGNIALLTIPAIPSTTDDISEGSNLYYTEPRFDASLGGALVTQFPAAVQTSLGLADTALQSGDNLSTLTNDSGFITATNLAYTAAPSQGTITSDAGTNATLPAADGTNAGLLLPAEKTKLTGIEAGAETNNISDVDATDLTDGGDTSLHTHPATGISDSTALGRTLLAASDAAAARAAIGAGPPIECKSQLFTTSGTFTTPTNYIANTLRCIVIGGGGGGGGGTNNYAGGGGGGGGLAVKLVTGLAVGDAVAVTVGAGGSGGSLNADGGSGGTSSFGIYCSATGGAGGGRFTTGGRSGVGTGGDLNIGLGAGSLGVWMTGYYIGGTGGGPGGGVGAYTDSFNTTAPGSGGAGAGRNDLATFYASSAGSAGLVFCTWLEAV